MNNAADKFSQMSEKERTLFEINSHLDSIINNVDRMTSGNFMHNKNAVKLSANIIKARIKTLNITL